MASYSKQMIEIAKRWLAANPDPESPFLAIPKLHRAHDYDAQLRKLADDRVRLAETQRPAPELSAGLDQLEDLLLKAREASGQLRDLETGLERRLNKAPEAKHEKFDDDTVVHAGLGRWCLAWARHGYNVFDLSPDFTAAMLLTDPRGLDIDRVRLPFHGLLFLIPDGFARGREGNHYTKIHVTELTYGDVQQLDVANKISGMLDKLTVGARQSVIANATNSLVKLGENAQRSRSLITRGREEVTHLHIYATDGTRVLSTMIERKGLTWDAFDDLPSEIDFTADVEAMQTIRRVVFGALAYATAVPSAVVAAGPARPPRASSSAEPSPTRWEVGRTIKIDHNLVRSARAGSRETALRLKSRWIVRGHYRDQPYGPGRASTKNIWITPFWKGPTEGAELVHTYKLEDGADATAQATTDHASTDDHQPKDQGS